MKDLLEVCCGLDVHKEMIAACLLSGSLGTEPKEEVREFSTLLSGLEEMREWLKANNCRDIAMESTGVYWFPIYNVLEAGAEEDFKFNITVANPYHMKNVPGKKTDIKDSRWIAGLLRAGLLEPSYIPPREIRELRDWTRYRRTLVQEMTGHKNRIEKQLQTCGFKLSTVLTDIFGKTGMALIRKLCEAGSIEPEEILNLLHGTARKKLDVIRQAVNGRMDGHDRAFLSMLVRNYEQSLKEIEDVEREIYACAQKYEPSIALLETIPGISGMTAITMISELGTDLSMFPTSGYLCSWAGVVPGDNESAGKKKSNRLKKGNPYVKCVICQCAWAATRARKNYLREWFYRLSKRRGMKKAVIALGHKLLVIVYNILTTGEAYDESRFAEVQKRVDESKKMKLIAQARKYGLVLTDARGT